MGSGYAKRKKQAKALQQQFAQMQEEMAKAEIEGSAGNGLVTVIINGEGELKKISIKPDCVDPEDVEGLEDLIQAAFADAQKKVKEQSPMPDLGNLGDLGGMGGLGAFGL
jgi:DNA-binding YbaB/EbfC family protein